MIFINNSITNFLLGTKSLIIVRFSNSATDTKRFLFCTTTMQHGTQQVKVEKRMRGKK